MPEHADTESAAIAGIDRERIVALASRLVAARSENPGGTERGTVALLAVALTSIGARIDLHEVEPDRPNLFARLGPESFDGGLLFVGHSDVVPAGPGWSAEPFEPRHEDGDLIGRGSADMKGGLAAVVEAMRAIHAACPDLPLGLLCTMDEEVDASGVRAYLGDAPPIRPEACIVAEPTDLAVIVGCRGAMNLRIDVRGRSAHAGRPSDGASAIEAAADLIEEIREDATARTASPHPTLGAATWNIGTIAGGHGTSIVPDRCSVGVDRRLLPGEDPEEILERLLTGARTRLALRDPSAADIRIDGRIEMTMPGFCTPEDAPLVRLAADALERAGRAPAIDVWTASCEGGFIAERHGVPTIVLGPGDVTTQAHQPDERVAIADLVTAAEVYTRIGLRLGDPRRAIARPAGPRPE